MERGREECYIYETYENVASMLAHMGQDDGLSPSLAGTPVLAGSVLAGICNEQPHVQYVVAHGDIADFLSYVCPRLQERRDLLGTTGRLREERERLRQRVATVEAEKEQLQQQLRREQRRVSEATAENDRLSGDNTKLRHDISKAERGIVEARREANEARVAASSLQKKLAETETAYEEAKKHFIMAPDLVPCLRSLTTEVKALQEEVRASGEKTTEAVVRRPPDEQRNGKTLRQMRRVLHDIGRFPRRRRRAKAADAADDGRGAIRRGRICYSCRCKGHLAKNCPRVRTDTVASAEPTVSDTQSRSDVAEELNTATAYSGLNILSFFRRNFTSGID